MSDFDKEAERQKLREKYERDREKRKETERMSQLLLQGATMTNRHCGTCGDPLFRYEGTEFCATCEGAAEEATQQNTASAQSDEAATADGEHDTATAGSVEPTDGERDTPTDAGGVEPVDVDDDAAGHPSPEAATASAESESPDGRQPPTPREGRQSPAISAAHDAQPATAARDDATEPGAETPVQGSVDADADLAAARESLVRTLAHHAQRAEAVDGPRRATDHLAAVREAAEALAALDRTRR